MNIRSEKKKKNRNNQRVVRHPSLDAARAHTHTLTDFFFFFFSMFPYFFFGLGKGRKQIHPAAAAAGRSFSSDTEKTGRFPISKRKHFCCAQLHPEEKKKNRRIYHLISSIHTHTRAHTHTYSPRLSNVIKLNCDFCSKSLFVHNVLVCTHTHTGGRTRAGVVM